MSCEHLVCASCAGPVAEGRCPACRATHAARHGHGHRLTAEATVVLAVLLALIGLIAVRLTTG